MTEPRVCLPTGQAGTEYRLKNENGFKSAFFVLICAHVAQLAEHILGKDEVTGSIPVMGSRRIKTANSYQLAVVRLRTDY